MPTNYIINLYYTLFLILVSFSPCALGTGTLGDVLSGLLEGCDHESHDEHIENYIKRVFESVKKYSSNGAVDLDPDFHEFPILVKKHIVQHQQKEHNSVFDPTFFLNKSIIHISSYSSITPEKVEFIVWLIDQGAYVDNGSYKTLLNCEGFYDARFGYYRAPRNIFKDDLYRAVLTHLADKSSNYLALFDVDVTPYEQGSFLELPRPLGDPLFDNKFEEIISYVNIINEYRTYRCYSKASVKYMNDALLKGMHIFQEKIESAAGFNKNNSSYPYTYEHKWEIIKTQTHEIIASEKITIPTLHIMFLRFILLSDYFQITDSASRELFKLKLEPRLNYLMKIYGKKDRNISWQSIIDLEPFKFVNGLSNTDNIDLSELAEVVPALAKDAEDPHFGLLAFFYAFFNKIGINCYAINGSSTAHGGYLASIKKNLAWSCNIPKAQRLKISAEKFKSSLIFLAHDWMHIEIYRTLFCATAASSFQNYKNLFIEIIESASHNPNYKIDLAILFMLTHEFGITLPESYDIASYNLRTKEQLLASTPCENELILFIHSHYPPFDAVKPSLLDKYKDSHPEEYERSRRARSIFAISDMANLMKICGLELELNPEEPWMWGPSLAEQISAHLRSSPLWQPLMSIAPAIEQK